MRFAIPGIARSRGVVTELEAKTGRLVLEPGAKKSDARGLIRFKVIPDTENPMAGRVTTDRFLFYRSVVGFRLHKTGYLSRYGEVEDFQEFASFSNPSYQVLNRSPSPDPLSIPITLNSLDDYLAAGESRDSWFDSVFERVGKTPGSTDRPRTNP